MLPHCAISSLCIIKRLLTSFIECTRMEVADEGRDRVVGKKSNLIHRAEGKDRRGMRKQDLRKMAAHSSLVFFPNTESFPLWKERWGTGERGKIFLFSLFSFLFFSFRRSLSENNFLLLPNHQVFFCLPSIFSFPPVPRAWTTKYQPNVINRVLNMELN